MNAQTLRPRQTCKNGYMQIGIGFCVFAFLSVEENESNGSEVPVDVHSEFDATRGSYCLLSSITCWFNGELPTSGEASRNESELADTQRSDE